MLGFKDYCFSNGGEVFWPLNALTRQSAAEELQSTYDDLEGFEIGIMIPVTAEEVLPDLAETVIDSINENACANYGECAEDYLVCTPKGSEIILDKMLRKTVLKWIEMFDLKPTFFSVTDREYVTDILKETAEKTEILHTAAARQKHLTELLMSCSHRPVSEQAEYLTNMGVISPAFILGQTVYALGYRKSQETNDFKMIDTVYNLKKAHNVEIFEVPAQKSYVTRLGSTVFLTESEARKALTRLKQTQN